VEKNLTALPKVDGQHGQRDPHDDHDHRRGLTGQGAILGGYAGGSILIVNAFPRAISNKFYKYLSTGIRPGIRSIGLNAYPTTRAAKRRAYHGPMGP
jgi:hypothetical protein